MNVQNWPAHRVEVRKRAELRGYERNSRTHSEEQVAQIAASIREWGWTVPVLVDPSGEVLGIDDIPCMVADGWTEAQKRAYVIADNKLAENGGWDESILAGELAWLAEADFGVDLIGFSDEELGGLLSPPVVGNSDPDDVPPAPDVAATQRGDVWLLGSHRLRCGDATDEADVAALLGAVRPHLMVTDPPYGVNYDPSWRAKFAGKGLARGKVQNDDSADWSEAWALFPGDVAYVWHAGLYAGVVGESLRATGFTLRSQIVWKKSNFAIGRGDYHWHHEPCWYAVKGKGHWSGDRKQSTIWEIAKPAKSETGHSTQKPVECMRRPIVNNSSPGHAVYEPFCGSGTTIIAGEMEGRHVYAMELSEVYCDVIVRRWQEFTGREATLEATGQTYAAVAAERLAA